jgi:uncharacterized protein YggE
MITRSGMAAVGLLVAMVSDTSWGQPAATDGQGAVSGMGTGEVQRLPEVMRMRIVITTKGKDLNEALAGLKDRVAAAKTQVAALGADKATVTSDEPQLAVESNDRRRQMEMMMAQRMRGGRRPTAKKEEVKPPVSVSTTLTAQWPLKATAGEQLLIAAAALQEKIKAADLAGTKEQSKLSAEEQELSDELAAEQMAMFNEEGPKPGEPMFMFVAPISAAEREKLLADGFKKAKERAARLAKAAGAELGSLRVLSDHEMDASDEMFANAPYSGSNATYRMMQMMRGNRTPSEEISEAVGAQPGKVVYRVMVTASFDLKSK